jgi:hypothetical protein
MKGIVGLYYSVSNKAFGGIYRRLAFSYYSIRPVREGGRSDMHSNNVRSTPYHLTGHHFSLLLAWLIP